MITSPDGQSAVNEEIWQAWVQKGKLRDQTTARRFMWLAGTLLVVLAAGAVFFLSTR
jgi:hypothetical protein